MIERDLEARVRDYVAAERAAVRVPPMLRLTIRRAIETSRSTAEPRRPRALSVAALVAGLLLLAAGIAWLRTVSHASPAGSVQGSWSPVAGLATGRAYQTATLLPNGKVLVVGGTQVLNALSDAALYDPASRIWGSAGAMSSPRANHTATLLRNGTVLVAGGSPAAVYEPLTHSSSPADFLASADLYDPRANSWSPAASMHVARSGHTATRLPDGRVLVVGGTAIAAGGVRTVLASSELYDPGSNTWALAAPMAVGRSEHAATLLPDGRVLVVGGVDAAYVTGNFGSSLSSVELYDPATNRWSSGHSLQYGRILPTSTLLPDGRVLVVGDMGANEGTAELFDLRTNRWSPAPNCGVLRAGSVAVQLRDGRVLVAGGIGEKSAQVFDWRTSSWSSAGGTAAVHSNATGTVLANGRVLVVGGFGSAAGPLASVELYDPTGVHQVNVEAPLPRELSPLLGGLPLAGLGALLLGLALWSLRQRRRQRDPDLWLDPDA